MKPDSNLLAEIGRLAETAGRAIMPHYQKPDLAVATKSDGSPVSTADHAAEAVILKALHRLTEHIPVVSEEAAESGHVPVVGNAPFWLVDPLDGTKEFIAQRDQFTVNIALVVDRQPVLGVVHAPALNETYLGLAGTGAWRRGRLGEAPITVRKPPARGLTAIASRSHGNNVHLQGYLDRFHIHDRQQVGSSLKFCEIAAGSADLYPRFGHTCEWDTAAGQAVLAAAGGRVETEGGSILRYGKSDFINPVFIAFGGLPPGAGRAGI